MHEQVNCTSMELGIHGWGFKNDASQRELPGAAVHQCSKCKQSCKSTLHCISRNESLPHVTGQRKHVKRSEKGTIDHVVQSPVFDNPVVSSPLTETSESLNGLDGQKWRHETLKSA